MKTLFLMLIPVLCMAQIHRPLPAVICMADELDIHDRGIASTVSAPLTADTLLLDKISHMQDLNSIYSMENSKLKTELAIIQENRRIEKKIAGIAGLLLFVSGNNDLKNIGLVSLFCYSIW